MTQVALVSSPWMGTSMPSIQLSILDSLLSEQEIACERYELFLDFAAEIGVPLYERLSTGTSFVPEWIFSKIYFDGAQESYALDEFLVRRSEFMFDKAIDDATLEYSIPIAEYFVELSADAIAAAQPSIVAFSLTISQTAASMALAKAIKSRLPQATIVFGGSSCSGVMGRAIMEVCKEVDYVIHIEAELVFTEFVRRILCDDDPSDLAGISWRSSSEGSVKTNHCKSLWKLSDSTWMPRYDQYFERLAANKISQDVQVWLPLESSRGCWYGSKRQCTFCGLHEIMKFREKEPSSVYEEIQHLADRYDVSKIFCVDLIMPHRYYATLLPMLGSRPDDVELFYEIKANVNRKNVEILSDAGVKWVQPGIESLDDDLLRLMRKGTTTLQNIFCLKSCQDNGIRVTWSMLIEVPGETQASYENMIELLPKLYHLPPPSGCNRIEVHRYSPYFENPEQFGMRDLEPHSLYKSVFPVDKEVLGDLVYLFEYQTDLELIDRDILRQLRAQVDAWQQNYKSGACLFIRKEVDGSSTVVDQRNLREKKEIPISPEEHLILQTMDEPTRLRDIEKQFGKATTEKAIKSLSTNSICKVLDKRVISLVSNLR